MVVVVVVAESPSVEKGFSMEGSFPKGRRRRRRRWWQRGGGGISAQGGRRKRDRDGWSETRGEEERETEKRRGKGGVGGGRGQCGGFDGRLVAQ